MPPFPLAPLKFSGLMERVFASDIRKRLPIFVSIPLNLPCASAANEKTRENKKLPVIFLFMQYAFIVDVKFPGSALFPGVMFLFIGTGYIPGSASAAYWSGPRRWAAEPADH